MAAPYYTTFIIVKDRLKHISADLVEAKVLENIEIAEGMINVVMKADFTLTFDETKHGLIRQAATCLAAFMCLTYDPEEFTTVSFASMTADLLWAEADRALAILSDPNVVVYLQGL